MDVCILAGGYGTRLKGIWDGPKCLIPYQGRPLIEHLVEKAMELAPRKVFLLLGHRASEVVAWREGRYPHRDVVPVIETVPSGTATAIRYAFPFIIPHLIVLNGDTIPEYNINEIAHAFNETTGRTMVAWSGNRYAGTAVFGAHGIDQIVYSKEINLDTFVNDPSAQRFHVPGFLDVGTPEAFAELKVCRKTASP